MNFRAPLAMIARAFVPFALFGLVFSIVAAGLSLGLRQVEDMPDMAVLSPKLTAYRAEAERYNTVFIGTSRTLYHISPEDVEAAAAAEGCADLKVFNFGVFGLTGAEQEWLIGEVLAAGKGHLETLILEDPLPEARRMSEANSTRARYFNDPANLPDRMASIASYPESLPKRLFRTGILGYGVMYDLSGVGRAAGLVFPEADPPPAQVFNMDKRGFEVLGSVLTEDIKKRRADFLSHPEAFEAALARYGAPTNEAVEARADYLVARMAALEERGLKTALFVSADPQELDRTPRVGRAVQARNPAARVINLNQPDRYPDLFERDLWFDFSHVGEAGARLMSRKAGTELCQAMNGVEGGDISAIR